MTERAPSTQEKYPEFLEDQRQFFDELITREWHTYQNAYWDRSRRFEVDRLFSVVRPRKVLDVGCGCGFHDVLMAQKPGVEQVVGIDYSRQSIETANQEYAHPNVRRIAQDIRNLAGGEQYDLVVSFQVIEHLSDAKGFLATCAGHTRVGGHVAVITPNRLRLANRLRILAGRDPKFGDPQHFHEFTSAELASLGEGAGLAYVDRFAYGLSPRVPNIGLGLPASIGLRLGSWFPALADCFGVIFRRATS